MRTKKIIILFFSMAILVLMFVFSARFSGYVINENTDGKESFLLLFLNAMVPLLLGFLLAIITLIVLWSFEKEKFPLIK